MSDTVAIHVLSEMVRADLELAFDHLNNRDYDLALRELNNASEKILQVKQASGALAVEVEQQRLLTITLDDHQTTGTGTDPKINN